MLYATYLSMIFFLDAACCMLHRDMRNAQPDISRSVAGKQVPVHDDTSVSDAHDVKLGYESLYGANKHTYSAMSTW